MDEFEVSQKKEADIHIYKCPSCGAQLEFYPNKQALVCPHCQTEMPVEFNSNVSERDFSELYTANKWVGDIKVIRCDNCGSQQVLKNNEIATRCPFCGSHAVLQIQEFDGIKPDSAIPFKISRPTAKAACSKWLKSRFFAPSKFKKQVLVENVQGCYCPVWTFDSNTVTEYSGTFGQHYYVTVHIDGKAVIQQRTRYYDSHGSVSKFFDDIFIQGTKNIDDKFLQRIQPFGQKDYVQYDDNMLAGFVASNYTTEPLDAWRQAEGRMNSVIREMIVSKENADLVMSLRLNTHYVEKSFKYLLIPIYITAVTYKGKLFNQYINGIHGRVAGIAPQSPLKIGTVILLALGLIIGLIALIAPML